MLQAIDHDKVPVLDPVAGHIPDSLNRFFKNNPDVNEFKPAEILRKEYS